MTKELTLQRDDDVYRLGKTPIICNSFVSKLIGDCQQVHVTISTEEIASSSRAYVCKEGYYRWYWVIPESKTAGGMFIEAEEIIDKLFPDAQTNGLDKPKPIWILFKKLL